MNELLAPQVVDAERSLLGGLIQRPDRLDEVSAVLARTDFFREDHGALFDFMRAKASAGEVVDLVTLPLLVQADPNPSRLGGVAYVIGLPEWCPSTTNLLHYAGLIRDAARRRRLMDLGRRIVERAAAMHEPLDETLNEASGSLVSMLEGRGADWRSYGDILPDVILDIEKRSKNQGGLSGIPTGFAPIDDALCGFQRGDLLILGARPSMGKTALAMNMAEGAALSGCGVGFISLEMSDRQLVARSLSGVTEIDGQDFRKGRMDIEKWTRLLDASPALESLPIYVIDQPGMSLGAVRAAVTRLQRRDPNLGLVVIDYLQLMSGNGRADNRMEQVSEISRGLKALAREANVATLALSQLSRNIEQRSVKIPQMSDLRESGQIEQDADVILFVSRPDYYDVDDQPGLAIVKIAKQRNGPVGDVWLRFDKDHARFSDRDEMGRLISPHLSIPGLS